MKIPFDENLHGLYCSDLHSQSRWQSTIQTSESWHWNISCFSVLSISHILSGSLSHSHHLSPKGRILEESLIIFTAHSIIPTKRLIHDLPQWRPTPPSQEEGEAKQERESASYLSTSAEKKNISSVITFTILNSRVGWESSVKEEGNML